VALGLAVMLGAAAPPKSDPPAAPASAPKLDLSHSRFAPPPDAAPTNRQRPLPARPRGAAASGDLVLMFTGDNKLCGRTAQEIARFGADYPYALVTDTLHSADIAFGNCEGTITACALHTAGKTDAAIAAREAFVFKSDPQCSGNIFAAAGFGIMQLANNHAMDFGGTGLADTCDALDGASIAHVGAGADYPAARAPAVIAAKGVRVGFLAYSLIVPPLSAAGHPGPGINTLPWQYAAALKRDIGELRQHCDFVVVGFHWGKEGSAVPNADQRKLGHAAIDAGADLVIGGHPHTFQGAEFYNGGLIEFSMGNFVFSGASPTIASGILRVTVHPPQRSTERPQITSAALLPCWVRAGRPTPSADKRLRGVLARDMRATGSELVDDADGWLTLEPALGSFAPATTD